MGHGIDLVAVVMAHFCVCILGLAASPSEAQAQSYIPTNPHVWQCSENQNGFREIGVGVCINIGVNMPFGDRKTKNICFCVKSCTSLMIL